jgi:hypothetical protein
LTPQLHLGTVGADSPGVRVDGSRQVKRGDELDVAWYAAAYPQVDEDIAAGRARDAADHYAHLGQSRGYLPNLAAARPRDPAGFRSAFGGLWTDQGNALDLVEGKLELGRITARQAELLRRFITDGYVVLEKAVPPWTLWRARRALEAAYAGKIEGLQFSCPSLGFDVGPWVSGVADAPAKALEMHAHSQAVCDVIFSPAISAFLALLFDRRAMATQTLGFYRGSAQGAHQDTAYVTYTLPLQFAASWIALEDVRAGAGELFYRAGSQRLGDFLYAGEFKAVSEGQRLRPNWSSRAEEELHRDSLVQRSVQEGYDERTFLARKGDVLIWAADLAHGGKPINLERTRRSIVTHYCPAEVAPLYFEGSPRKISHHRSGNRFTTLL